MYGLKEYRQYRRQFLGWCALCRGLGRKQIERERRYKNIRALLNIRMVIGISNLVQT